MAAHSLADTLARRVREIRERRGWSLDHLSKAASVSRGALVALENGSANPNLSTLCRLPEALNIPVSELLDYDGTPEVRIAEGQPTNALWTGPRGGWAAFVLAESDPVVEVWQWRLHPGEHYDAVPYDARATKIISVTHGELVLSLASGDYTIRSGTKAIFRATVAHRYAASGRTACDMHVMTVVA